MNTLPKAQQESDGDLFLERLKKSKQARSVLKVEFASFASAIPDNIQIFSFEGPDDRVIYGLWINKIAGDIKYEAYQCNGKKQVLQLFDILKEDKTGLGDRVYYFVDKDFDGLQGRENSERIFMTDRYSIENYVVDEDVLENVLNIYFHCHGCIGLRNKILIEFKNIYQKFLEASFDVNFRIFSARYYKIETAELPSSLYNLLEVHLDRVVLSNKNATEIVHLKTEPTTEQLDAIRPRFHELVPHEHYRGKFAIAFFSRWLSILRNDRLSDSPSIFKDVLPPANGIKGDFSFQSLAPWARPPTELTAFLEMIRNNSKGAVMA